MAPTTTFPVLPLAHPRILFPTSRLTVPVDRDTALAIQALLQEKPDGRPHILAVPSLSQSDDDRSAPQLADMGTVARVIRVVKTPATRGNDFVYFVLLHGVGARAHLTPPLHLPTDGSLARVKATPVDDAQAPSNHLIEPFRSAALVMLTRLAADPSQSSRNEGWRKVREVLEDMTASNALHLANMLVGGIEADYPDKLEFLTGADTDTRLVTATKILVKHNSISEVSQKITSDVNESLSKQQKEFYLRQQLAAIQRELAQLQGTGDTRRFLPGPSGSKPVSELDDDTKQDADELNDMRSRIEALDKESDVRKVCVREWRRMKRTQPSSVEQGVIRSYLEWVVSLPWPTAAGTSQSNEALVDPLFLKKAKEQLDADHFGLDKIKQRLIEYLAVVRLKHLQIQAQQRQDMNSASGSGDASAVQATLERSAPMAPLHRPQSKAVKGPILLFVGPPGVGKTSLGQSVARALNRPFQRISLGGVRDEAEIRGHRRTYVASGPGVIVQALRKAGRLDPVILLDEIDKLAQNNFHGDPGAALLEVLDPEQNHTFNDHYINTPVDLSSVLFICTANSLDTISAPLLDRCEVIQLSGYTHDEKFRIASRFLIPKQVELNALTPDQVRITDGALKTIVTGYTREAGVRSLERSIAAVVRHKAYEWAESQDGSDHDSSSTAATGSYTPVVEEQHLEKILGISWSNGDDLQREEHIGTVYGLVVSGAGEGATMPVESAAVPGSGKLKLTGSLGDVIKESAEIAYSWVCAHADELGIKSELLRAMDVHMHLPAGAQRKDGPSAGTAMICAIVSLLTGMCVPSHVAMTGEITLRGRITPVGGIKEKVLGAHHAGIKTVLLPWGNKKDVEHDLTPEIQQQIHIVFVQTIDDVLAAAFGKGWPSHRLQPGVLFDSRL